MDERLSNKGFAPEEGNPPVAATKEWVLPVETPGRRSQGVVDAALDGQEVLAIARYGSVGEAVVDPDVRTAAAAALAGLRFDDAARRVLDGVVGEPVRSTLEFLAAHDAVRPSALDAQRANSLLVGTDILATSVRCYRALYVRCQKARGCLMAFLGQPVNAASVLEAALARSPSDRGVMLDLAAVLLDAGFAHRGASLLEQAEAQCATRRSRLQWARFAGANGQPEVALSFLEQALDARLDSAEACAIRRAAWKEIRSAAGESAGNAFFKSLRDEARRATRRRRNLPTLRAIRLQAANQAFQLGLTDREVELLRPLVHRGNASLSLVLRVARLLLKLGDAEGAAQLLDSQREARRARPAWLSVRGLVLLTQGYLNAAEIPLTYAMHMGEGPETALGLAYVLLRQERPEHALETLDAYAGNLPFHLRPTGLDLRSAALERVGRPYEALRIRGEALGSSPSFQRRVAFGRLSVSAGLREAGGATQRTALLRGIAALSGVEDAASKALRCLAELALGRDVEVTDLPREGNQPSWMPHLDALVTAVRLELVRKRLAQGRIEDAAELAQELTGDRADGIREELRIAVALKRVERVGFETDPASLVTLVRELRSTEPRPIVCAAVELLESIKGPLGPPRLLPGTVESVPVGLRLALAQTLAARGGDPDRVEWLLQDLVDTEKRGSAEARVIVAFANPDKLHPGLERDLVVSRAGTFPFLGTEEVRALEGRACLLAGGEPSTSEEDPQTPLQRDLASLRALEEAKAQAAAAAPPRVMACLLEDVLQVAPTKASWTSPLKDWISVLHRASTTVHRIGGKPSAPPQGSPPTNEMKVGPLVGELERARSLLDAGRHEEADHLLQSVYRASAAVQDAGAMRTAIELLHGLDEERKQHRLKTRRRTLEEAFAKGRYRTVLSETGGRAFDSTLPPECLILRVWALLALHQEEEGAHAYQLLRQSAALQGRERIGRTSFEVERALGAGAESMGLPWMLLVRLYREGDLSAVLPGLEELARERPDEPGIGLLRALCLRDLGGHDEALTAAEHAAHAALGRGDAVVARAARRIVRQLRPSTDPVTESLRRSLDTPLSVPIT